MMIHIGTIDFYNFISLSFTLNLAGGLKVSLKQNPLPSFFSHTFQLTGITFDMGLEQLKSNILILLLSEI